MNIFSQIASAIHGRMGDFEASVRLIFARGSAVWWQWQRLRLCVFPPVACKVPHGVFAPPTSPSAIVLSTACVWVFRVTLAGLVLWMACGEANIVSGCRGPAEVRLCGPARVCNTTFRRKRRFSPISAF